MLSKLFQRKKKFVSGPIQGRLMLRMGVYWVLYHIILWHAMFVFRYIEYRVESTATGTFSPISQLYDQFLLDYYPIIFCAVIALPIVLVDLMNLTHRIAGPLVRFQHALRSLIAGEEVRKVALRKGDLLIEFQDEFNKYLDFLKQQQQALVENADSLTAGEEELLIEVDQLRNSVQNALRDAVQLDDSSIGEEDTAISATMPQA